MNIIAFYLPQYHSIPENDEWWGKDYTEWDSLKRGEVLVDGQYQPRVPLDNNYYDLTNIEVMKWQADLARKYGVYGFCVYHYWFNGKLLLEKPMEQLLCHPEIDFPYCFCWANEDWSNIWEGNVNNIRILISNTYDNRQDWVDHFNYFLPYFKDPRYIKMDNKPILVIYNPLLIKEMSQIRNCWDTLAKQAGFSGIIFMYQTGKTLLSNDRRKGLFDYGIEYYPGLAGVAKKNANQLKTAEIIHQAATFLRQKAGMKLERHIKENTGNNQIVKEIEEYDEIWKFILDRKPESGNIIPGAFVDWDNTPRRKYAGKVILGANPEKFKYYLYKQILRAKDIYHKNMLFIFAWNEWSEGGYLEPDEKYKYEYLEAIRDALIESGEFPDYNESFYINR